ncbi:Fe3+-siderophore ABC transporter permease [Solibacillus sp. FSL K6-1126]|uniref:Fe3+-siderophore ABC transporter permease n=1 Tax=Solibacillus sp. FSL K6-1126 TaxID=2921463 RepID=UPI0030FBA31F
MMQILLVILIWVLPIILLRNAYFKMDKEEQQKVKSVFKQPLALFCVGLLVIGYLLSFSGIFLAIALVLHIGVTMVFIGWFTSIIVGWKIGKLNLMKSAVFILLGVLGIVIYVVIIT